ncbi:MAG: hypothetical protein DI603_17025 [Roseateles depolymerans]|uniref:Integral membrane protein n=1 Tax=Roseateles depolymerans TaxID=76731 RepID=A0A2W5DHW1_9BURK|nr:MAG: hypothetical protein DI603_17025 [Roseateles depolymerans]
MNCAVSDGPEAPPDPAGDAVPYRPYVPEPTVSRGPQFAQLTLGAPLRWLALGARDLIRAPGTALFFGTLFALMGLVVLAVFRHAPAYTLALCAGFLLLGPLLCLGLYDTSRRLERGEPPSLIDAVGAWLDNVSQIAIFGAALLVLEMLWGRAALVVFAVSFDGMPDFAGSIAKLLDARHAGFVAAYLGVGALFGGLIFSVSVIAMPLLLDRDTDAISAALLSLRLCLSQPLTMLFWGLMITTLVVLAMLPMFAGLIVIGPWLGHASWHAYRAALPPSGEPG